MPDTTNLTGTNDLYSGTRKRVYYDEIGVVNARYTYADDGTQTCLFYTDGILNKSEVEDRSNIAIWDIQQSYFNENGVILSSYITYDNGN